MVFIKANFAIVLWYDRAMSKQSLKEYYAIIADWKIRYPPPPAIKDVNLTKIKARCFRCGASGRLERHHTGSDFFHAKLFPGIFAARYLEYHIDDTEKLCKRCHSAAHRYPRFHKLYQEMWSELNDYRLRNHVITGDWSRKWMAQFREAFYEWCKEYKPRSTLVTKNDKTPWKKSRYNPRKRP